MTRKKKFDSVDMKWRIQQEIREEYSGMPDGEARRIEWERILADPILGPFVKKVRSSKRAQAA